MWDQVNQALHQATQEFLTKLASLLPEIIALIVALLISIVLAWMIAFVVRRMLVGVHFDRRVVEWGFPPLEEQSPIGSPTLLISRAVAIAVIIVGLMIGIAAFDSESITFLAATIFAYIPNVIGAILVLLIGTIASRFFPKCFDRRGQYELSIWPTSQRGREVAGDRPDRRDGS